MIDARLLSSLSSRISRRSLLQIGSLGLGGLNLAQLMHLRAMGAVRPETRQKSVIMVYLPGGASHIDMYDLKPEAPLEYRGEFQPIATNVPGLDVCELMPPQAQVAHKFSILRGLKTRGNHDPTELLSGVPAAASGQIGSRARPAIGCVVSRLRGVDGPIPPYVSVSNHKLLGSYDDPENPAYLGPAHRPISLDGQVMEDLKLPETVAESRLAQRKQLLTALDQLNRSRKTSGQTFGGLADEMHTYSDRALEMITSTRISEALDLKREPESIRRIYGEGTDRHAEWPACRPARRLVEAGVSLVSVAARFRVSGESQLNDPGGWDTHATNFAFMRWKLPNYDQAVAALITDLHERGMAEDTAVVIWSECGRRPRIGDVTPDGRGHWPEASCALIAGGGLRMGQVVGETDRYGERARFRPYGTPDVLATIYHVLGIDLRTTIEDDNGRPQFLLDQGEPLRELV